MNTSIIPSINLSLAYLLLKQTWTGELNKKYTYFVYSDSTTSNIWNPFLYERKLIVTVFLSKKIIAPAKTNKLLRATLEYMSKIIMWHDLPFMLQSYIVYR
jgi:hypothetical protein